MDRKLLFSGVVLCAICLNSWALVDNAYNWTNADEDYAWGNPNNWTLVLGGVEYPGELPDAAAATHINQSDPNDPDSVGCVLGPAITANVSDLYLGGPSLNGELTVDGGTLTVASNRRLRLADDSNSTVTLNLNSGSIDGGQYVMAAGQATSSVYFNMTGGNFTGHDVRLGISGDFIGVMEDGTFTTGSRLYLGGAREPGGYGDFTMNGGSMEIGGDFTMIGDDEDSSGFFTMNGGTLEFARADNNETRIANSAGTTGYFILNDSDETVDIRNLRVGYSGDGTLEINGGSMNAYRVMSVGYSDEATGRVLLNGGTLTTNMLSIGSGDFIDIAGGTLVLVGDREQDVLDWNAAGQILAYKARGELNIVVDTDTTVTATVEPDALYAAGLVQPRGGGIAQDAELSWFSGDYAATERVYFSDSRALVTSRDTSVMIYEGPPLGTLDPVLGDLDLGRTYYWTIDTIDDGTAGGQIWSSDVAAFTTIGSVLLTDTETAIEYSGPETSAVVLSGDYNLAYAGGRTLGLTFSGLSTNDIEDMSLTITETEPTGGGGTGWGDNLWVGQDGTVNALRLSQTGTSLNYPAGTGLTSSGDHIDGGIVADKSSSRYFESGIDVRSIYLSFLVSKDATGSGRIDLFRDDGVNRLGVSFNADGSLSVRSAGSAVATSAPGVLAADTTYLVVVKSTVSAISAVAYKDGDTIPADDDAVTWDVQGSRTSGIDKHRIQIVTSDLSVKLDELLIGSSWADVTSSEGTPTVTEPFDYTVDRLDGVPVVSGGDGSSAVFAFTGDSANMTQSLWTPWHLHLDDIISGGIDPAHVGSMSVTIGDGVASTGTGTITVHNIAVYGPRCLSGFGPHVYNHPGDINRDCAVNLEDFAFFAADWLETGYQVTAIDPGTANLALHYKFDETSGTTAYDEVGDNHATLTAELWDPDGYDGGCVTLSEPNYILVPPAAFDRIADSNEVTLSLWVKMDPDSSKASRQFLFNASTEAGTGHIIAMQSHPVGSIRSRIVFEAGHIEPQQPDWESYYYGWDETVFENPADAVFGNWNHFAMTKDVDAGVQRLYLNGQLVAQTDNATAPLSSIGLFTIGCFTSQRHFFDGSIDDFKVYDRALTHEEILFLSDASSPLNQPALSNANLDGLGDVDMDDLLLLVAEWLADLRVQ